MRIEVKAAREGSTPDSELAACAVIFAEAFRESPYFQRFQAGQIQAVLTDMMASPDTFLVLARNDQPRLVGFLMGQPAAGRAYLEDGLPPHADLSPYAYLAELAVRPAYQGKGVARALHDAWLDTVVAGGYRGILLGVWGEALRAQAFYAKLGYRPLGTPRPWRPSGPPIVTMELTVAPATPRVVDVG